MAWIKIRIQATDGVLDISFPEIKVNQILISAIAVIIVQMEHAD